jgi:hypothetical protein
MVQPYLAPIGKEKKYAAFSDLKLKETGVVPPTSNTGGHRMGFSLRPDYLTLSIPALDARVKIEELAKELFRYFCNHFKSGTKVEERSGRNYFKHGYYVTDTNGKELFSIHWGGNRGRTFIEIKGGGCKLLDGWQWAKIYILAVRYKARINRFDLAGDDWAGEIFMFSNIHAAYKKNKRSFLSDPSSGGTHVRPDVIDKKTGYTIEIGSDSTSYFHVIYQKFRESEKTYLGQQNPRWMRWEVRFYRQSKMEVDLKIIHPDNWGDAYLGSCAYLRELFGSEGARFIHRVEQPKESALDGLVAAYMANERQYGILNAELDRLGLGAPRRYALADVTPYASLTIYDRDEILKRIDSARAGALRSCASRAESDDGALF